MTEGPTADGGAVPEAAATAAGAARAVGRTELMADLAEQLGSPIEARWIVEHAGPERARSLAARRSSGEPLQYVLGRWPFRSVELSVDPRVLIPRPETEQVVEVALAELERSSTAAGVTGRVPRSVDLGTGSGAIALSLAVEGGAVLAGLEVWATDASADALAVARHNLDALADCDPVAAARVRLVGGSWFDALPVGLAGRLDLVVSNPPYVAESEYPGLDPVVRDFEPRSALVAEAGEDGTGGMAAIEAIVARAPGWLRPTGVLVVEISPSQADASVDAAHRAGFGRVTTARDRAGRLRVLVAGR
jgi:release factor glutamine methyltransferase